MVGKINGKSGFTIVELLIVIVVIGILAAITIVAFNGISNKANVSSANAAASQTSKRLAKYAVENSDLLPVDLSTAGITDDSASYLYTRNTTTAPQSFCLTSTVSGYSVHVATGGKPTIGPCAGHAGTAPTTLADGSSCPAGYVVVPGSSLYKTNAFCVMKYEAKNVSGTATSQMSGSPWVVITQPDATTAANAACSGCHLMSEAEWLTIAQNVISVGSNWSSGSVGSGFIYSGHNDSVPNNTLAAAVDSDPYNGTGQTTGSNQRRTLTLSNGEVIWDFAGNVWEWTQGQATGGLPGSSGLSFREWNSALATKGTLTVNPFPSYGNGSIAGWTTAQGIGDLYSDSSDVVQKGFVRGGSWTGGSHAGIYAFRLNLGPTSTFTDFGFRVAR